MIKVQGHVRTLEYISRDMTKMTVVLEASRHLGDFTIMVRPYEVVPVGTPVTLTIEHRDDQVQRS